MRLPLLAAAAAALLCGAAHGREAVALTADDFIAKVGTDAVWVVGFGLDADCPEMAKALAVQAEAEWLQVGWVDVAASPAARVLADVHQVGAYPGLVVVSPTGAVPLKALADVTLKNAVEKWLPPMVWDARRRGLVHTLPNAEDAESGEEDDDAADGFCTLYTTDIEDARSMAGLRAAALKFAGVLKQRVVVAEDAERSGTWVECTGREPGVEADSTPGYAAVVDYLAGLSDLAWTDADAAAFLAAARAAAAENEGESLVPKVSSFARWAALRNRARAIAPQAPLDAQVSILFLLDSKGKQFDAHFAEAAAFAKAGGGKIGRQIPVTVGWVDTAVEGEKLLRRFFEKPGDKAPHVAFVVPVQQNKQQPGQAPPPDGMMRGVMKSQKFDDFKADLILKFFETKLMSDGRIMPFDDDEQLANAVWSSKDVAVGPAEPEGEPWFLTVAGGADGKDKTNKEKKAAKAKKDKKKKKKKGDKKLTKKEEEKLEKIKAEQEAKKAAREKRIQEKKEREAKEKEEKKAQQKEEKKKPKKKKTKEELAKEKKEAEKKKKAERKAKKAAEKAEKEAKKQEDKKKKEEAKKRKEEDKKKRDDAKKKKEEEELMEKARAIREEEDKKKAAKEAAAAAAGEGEDAAQPADAGSEPAAAAKNAAEPEGAEEAAAAEAASEGDAKDAAAEGDEGAADSGKKKKKAKKELDPEKEKARREKQEKRRKEREEKAKQEREYREMMRKVEKERRAREKAEREEKQRQEEERRAEMNKEQRALEKEWAAEDGEDIVIDEL